MTNKISHDSETPAIGKQVITAAAFIHHNFDGVEKVFLPKRAATKKFLPNVFEMPGGHVDFGEDIIEGLKREIREELEMEAKVGDAFSVSTYVNEIKGSHSIQVTYFAEFIDSFEKIKLNPEDHSEFGWFSESEIDGVASENRRGDDPEIQTIRKGFEFLKGKKLRFN